MLERGSRDAQAVVCDLLKACSIESFALYIRE